MIPILTHEEFTISVTGRDPIRIVRSQGIHVPIMLNDVLNIPDDFYYTWHEYVLCDRTLLVNTKTGVCWRFPTLQASELEDGDVIGTENGIYVLAASCNPQLPNADCIVDCYTDTTENVLYGSLADAWEAGPLEIIDMIREYVPIDNGIIVAGTVAFDRHLKYKLRTAHETEVSTKKWYVCCRTYLYTTTYTTDKETIQCVDLDKLAARPVGHYTFLPRPILKSTHTDQVRGYRITYGMGPTGPTILVDLGDIWLGQWVSPNYKMEFV